VSKVDLSDTAVRKNVDYVTAQVHLGEGTHDKKIRLRFRVSPVEIIGENGRVTALKLEKNRLEPDGQGGVRAVGTGVFEVLPVGLVFRAVGYRGVPIPGVPFDGRSGKIPNAAGRVVDETGKPLTGEYVVGWAKRGPTGLIGTNRGDSAATVTAMLEDVQGGRVPGAERAGDIEPLLRSRQVAFITFEDWKQLDAHELARGVSVKKLREKLTRVEEMLRVVRAGH